MAPDTDQAPPPKEEAPDLGRGTSEAFGGAEINTTGTSAFLPDEDPVDDSSTSTSGSVPVRKRQHRLHDPSFRPTSKDTIVSDATGEYLSMIAANPALTLAEIRDGLLRHINNAIAAESRLRHKAVANAPAISTLDALDEATAVTVVLARHRIVRLDFTRGGDSAASRFVAMYHELGDHAGLYVEDDEAIQRLIAGLVPSMKQNAIESAFKRLASMAPVAVPTQEPHLVPVRNGVFDTARMELLPFSPDWVFLSKCAVDYDPDAESPVITHPVDGTVWEVEQWMAELSDDEGVPELLWEVVSAVLRPYLSWNRVPYFVGPNGNGGKGSVLELMRGLVGRGAYVSIPLARFGKPFALTGLLKSSRVLTDENAVGALAQDLDDFKAVVTGDPVMVDRKYKDPVMLHWNGFMVQCMNTMAPRVKDKSASFMRRALVVPLTKSFTGVERKYIKDEYLAREDVLRYVLKRALHMDHVELSEPLVCRRAWASWFNTNNSVRGFWEEFEPQFAWDLLPLAFLYDLYKAWFAEVEPGERPEGFKHFVEGLRSHLDGSAHWQCPAGPERIKKLMAVPEPLIAEYDLVKWKNTLASGNNPLSVGAFDKPKASYRCILRAVPAAAQAASTDDEGAGG